ncbi:hypothetical protein [Streptomyces aurantiogriseus]|nr:hypothetical protein [Streptomyces aurantiogriseus]
MRPRAGRGDLLADDHPMRHVARDIPPPTGVNLVVRGGQSAVLHGATP